MRNLLNDKHLMLCVLAMLMVLVIDVVFYFYTSTLDPQNKTMILTIFNVTGFVLPLWYALKSKGEEDATKQCRE